MEIDLGILNNSNDWILLNQEYTGFYRTKYSNEMLLL
jgi:hypothetical protein